MAVKFFDYQREYDTLRPRILDAVDSVFSSGQLILGAQVEQFEAEFAQLVGARFAAGLNSGTDALSIALLSVGVGEGDEVITVANTATATVAAIRAIGAIPRFVDVNDETLQIDAKKIAAQISAKTKAIVPVHLYGNAAPLSELEALARDHNLHVIEDCAHAHGSKLAGKHLGTHGSIGCFSFYPTKTIGAYGDAGACITNSAEIYERLKKLRMYGFSGEPVALLEGRNSRLDEVHAAILRLKLKSAADYFSRRQHICQIYFSKIKNPHISFVKRSLPNQDTVNHLFVIRTSRREQLMAHFKQSGIGYGTHYRYPIHLMPAYRFLGYKPGDLPITEKSCAEILSLPLYPTLSDEEVEQVCAVANAFRG